MKYVIIIIAVGQDCVTIIKIRLKMTIESDARENIDRLLEQAGWSVCDAARAGIHAARGVAIREFPLKSGHGFADYLFYVDGKAAGVMEAKKEGVTLTDVEIQSAKYIQGLSTGLPPYVSRQVKDAKAKLWDLAQVQEYLHAREFNLNQNLNRFELLIHRVRDDDPQYSDRQILQVQEASMNFKRKRTGKKFVVDHCGLLANLPKLS